MLAIFVALGLYASWWNVEDVFIASQSVNGVLMFRGNPTRNYFGQGDISSPPKILWRYRQIQRNGDWWGLGWTGQPLIVEWPEDTMKKMGLQKKWEVIVAALDGKVHFIDFETGKKTRPPLKVTSMPIKGTPTLDPRGLPLLYVGQGLPRLHKKVKDVPCGIRIFSLIDYKQLYFIDGAKTGRWPAFDGNPVVIPQKDTLLIAGENRLFYKVKLNTTADPLGLKPKLEIFEGKRGIESSVAVWGDTAYWTDNHGNLHALDIPTMQLVFPIVRLKDDTDGTIAIDGEEGKTYLYIGSEVDRQGQKGYLRFYKIDAKTGKIAWLFESPSFSMGSKIKAVNSTRSGGILSSAAVGRGASKHLVYFTTFYENVQNRPAGRIIALKKEDGKIAWSRILQESTFSSPILDDKSTVIVGAGNEVTGWDALSGEKLWSIELSGKIESTPVLMKDRIVVGTRSGEVVCLGQN